MKITYGGGKFPGYDYYKPTRDKTHELIDALNDFLSNDECVKIEFDNIEETMHAVSLAFEAFQKYAQDTIQLHFKGNAIYLQKEVLTPIEYDILKMLFENKID